MRHELRALLAVVLLWFCGARNLHGQISPGPLSKAHASLDGSLSCAKCHGAGGAAGMTTRCLSCHKEIATLQAQNRGFHARGGRGECSSCHPDHAGKDFALIKWPEAGGRDKFTHTRAGWALEEKHAQLSCQKCHNAELSKSAVLAQAPKRSAQGWVGLETTCQSCHVDIHDGTLSRECQSCHTAAGWSPAARFDHAKTDYPLTGKHADVECAKCHTTGVRKAADGKVVSAKFTLQHNDCVSCHRDPHEGRLRGACSNCHVTTSFSTVNDKSFSHERTRYPLRGRHASVSCASCHAGYPGKIDQPAFTTCASCHADPHAGKATLAGATVDCASCHTVAGFAPATFTVAQHARTNYPLQGKHTSVACGSCHTTRAGAGAVAARRGRPVTREVVMRPTADRCESCHTDAHAGQLASRGDKRGCVACHTIDGWKPATFGVREHATLKVPLTGKHATASCGSCHSAKRTGLPSLSTTRTLGTANVAFALSETSCDACHRDPHGARYNASSAPSQSTCTTCHDTRGFRPSTIDADAHAKFSFALDGAHRAAPCVACHTTMKASSLGAALKLSPAPAAPLSYALPGATCATCHGTPHGDQFARRTGGDKCESCHDLRAWSPASRFDHAANGGFDLGAAHAKVPCAKCHASNDRSGGKQPPGRVWRGVPRACESCHRGDVKPPSDRRG